MFFYSFQFALNCEAIESLPESFDSSYEVYSYHGTFSADNPVIPFFLERFLGREQILLLNGAEVTYSKYSPRSS